MTDAPDWADGIAFAICGSTDLETLERRVAQSLRNERANTAAQLAAKDSELKAQIDASHAVGYRQGAADMGKTKDAEIERLRAALDAANERVREMKIRKEFWKNAALRHAALKEDTNG